MMKNVLTLPQIMVALSFSLALYNSKLSAEESKTFFFDRFSRTCIDTAGNKGLNKNFVGVCSDLSFSDLSHHNLSGLDLRGSDLSGAHLVGTNFANADLRGANLFYTDWRQVIFSGAIYSETTLLPFDDEQAKKQGLRKITYKELDQHYQDSLIANNLVAALADINQGADIRLGNYQIFKILASNAQLDHLRELLKECYQCDIILKNSWGTDELFISYLIKNEFEEAFNILLEQGGKLGTIDSEGTSSLHLAAIANNPVYLKRLLEKGMDPNIQNKKKETPLYLAVKSAVWRTTKVELLIDSGADLAILPPGIDSLIDITSMKPLITLLIQKGADPKKINLWFRKDRDIINLLVSLGADSTRPSPDGTTLLMRAIKEESLDFIGFALSLPFSKTSVDKSNFSSWSYALTREDLSRDLIPLLAKAEIKPLGVIRVKNEKNPINLAWYAVLYNASLIELFSNLGANFNALKFVADNSSEQTAFGYLFKITKDFENSPIISTLLKAGADVNLIKDNGYNVLYSLVSSCSEPKRIEFLIDHGASLELLNYHNRQGETPIFSAVFGAMGHHNTTCLDILIARGANLYHKPKDGNYLTGFANSRIGIYLLQKGLDPKLIPTALRDGLKKVCNESDTIVDEGIQYTKALIAHGANTDLLPHDLLDIVKTKNQACWAAYFDNFAADIPDINVKKDNLNILGRALPVSADIFSDSYYFEKIGSKSYHENNQFYLDLTQRVINLGVSVDDYRSNSSIVERAYSMANVPLIKYLYSKGIKRNPFRLYTKVGNGNNPETACTHFIYDRKNYRFAEGGCATPTGLVWSMPSTMDHCYYQNKLSTCDDQNATGPIVGKKAEDIEYQNYCKNLRQGGRSDWQPPTFAMIMEESLRGGFNTEVLKELVATHFDRDGRGKLVKPFVLLNDGTITIKEAETADIGIPFTAICIARVL